jgi:hypothetical protein
MTGPNRSAWALDHQALIRYLIGLLLMFTKTPSPLRGRAGVEPLWRGGGGEQCAVAGADCRASGVGGLG